MGGRGGATTTWTQGVEFTQACSSNAHSLTHTHTHRAKKQQARTAPRDKTPGATWAFSLTCGGCPGARQRQGSGPGGEGRQAANGQGSRATHNHARQRGDGRACWWGANTLRGTARYPHNTQDGVTHLQRRGEQIRRVESATRRGRQRQEQQRHANTQRRKQAS